VSLLERLFILHGETGNFIRRIGLRGFAYCAFVLTHKDELQKACVTGRERIVDSLTRSHIYSCLSKGWVFGNDYTWASVCRLLDE
jgi:hypothetical protein